MPDYCFSISSPKQDLLLHIKEEGIKTKRLLNLPKVIQTSSVGLSEGQSHLVTGANVETTWTSDGLARI